VAALSYEGHPGLLHRIIEDNLDRCTGSPSTAEKAERIRAHCDFVRTAIAMHTTAVARVKARHGWTAASS